MRGALIVLTAALSIFSAAGVLRAQAPQTASNEKKFEVASVKPSLSPAEQGRLAAQNGGSAAPRRFGIQTQPGGRFSAGTTTLKRLIAEAFEVKEYQIDGGPPWLTTDYFDITANAGPDATPADVKAMLRALLADRFSLRTHSDTRQAPVYVLTIARSDGRLGSRLKATTPECVDQIDQQKKRAAARTATAEPLPEAELRQQRERMQEQLKRLSSGDAAFTAPCGTTMMSSKISGANALLSGGMEITSLVSQLSGELSAPVLDQTGLKGLFDMSLEYLSDRSFNGRPGGLDPNSTEPLPVPLTAALQQQLGLKLEKQTGPMPVVVIEAAEHPAPD